jgi:formate hydrogenlyase subunit 6/NADH:ubiquinone oxidoreductase subunit I
MKKAWHYIKTTLAIAVGLWVVFKQMFRKPVTIQRCVCCGLCAAACPADCIYMEPAENEKGERYAQIYEINELRCIFCGFCEEACPEEAIFLGKEYEFAADNRHKFIYTKEDLLVPWPRVKPSPINFIRKQRRHYAEEAPSLH